MRVLIVDGQGGRLGKQLVKEVLERFPQVELMAVGTNSMATESMLKVGAPRAATGENAVVVACRQADVILGPIGIVITDALLGEVTEQMAAAVGRSGAVRILIPMSRCATFVSGVKEVSTGALIADALDKLGGILENRG